jgi:hypothetical protein
MRLLTPCLSFPRLALFSASFLAAATFPAAADPVSAFFGPGGLFHPAYVTPTDHVRLTPPTTEGHVRTATGRAVAGRGATVVFAAGTVDGRCQSDGVATLKVLSGPAGRLALDLGAFTAAANDAGSTFCLGRQALGARLVYRGMPPAGGDRIVVRVVYPQTGLTFDHVVEVTARH